MQKCLEEICMKFEEVDGFLTQKTPENGVKISRLFDRFIECFTNLKEEKLNYPNEFITDVKLYVDNFEPIVKKFEDIEIRYLLLSDFYDFTRISRMYPSEE